MKVRITSCSDSMFWYSKKIGEIFLVCRVDTDRVWVKEDNEFAALNFILNPDLELEKYG